MLVGAAGALGLAALIPIRSLGRSPGDTLLSTKWTPGARLVTVDGVPVTETTLEVGSFTTVFPEGFEGLGRLAGRVDPRRARNCSCRPSGATAPRRGWSCTRRSAPTPDALSALPRGTHELRCPCHQSTFDVLDGARPVYRPAPSRFHSCRSRSTATVACARPGTSPIPSVRASGRKGDRPPGGRRARRTSRRVVVHQTEPRKVFPDHWSFMLGELALYSFVLLLLTGTFLDLFFVPSPARTVYTELASRCKGRRSRWPTSRSCASRSTFGRAS